MMPVNSLSRGYPLNAADSWHGGIHILNTDSGESTKEVRAIADGTVVSFRTPSEPWKREQYPLKYSSIRGTDDGYVLLKHETEIGTGEDGKVVFYSLYMHLKHLEAEIKADAKIYRKTPLGSSGMVDGQNEFHFQIFCDEGNIRKLAGRTTGELDIKENGRTDIVYGDIHFYLPAGTTFYEARPDDNTASTEGLNEVHTSVVPLYASMTFCKGACTMVTRQASANSEGAFEFVGTPLVNADGEDYEYNLYKTATSRYAQSPSAGYELLRFGRIINTEHETLVPADAPLWMTVNYPGGKGVVNLAVVTVKKFSDADFPHWAGWQLVDDDKDAYSQCNSATIRKLQAENKYTAQSSRLICCFPFEWEKSTIDARYTWLMTGLPWEQCTSENTAIWQVPGTKESKDRILMSEKDYDRFKQHTEALCFDSGDLGKGKVWHFDPRGFIEHFRKCGWLGENDIVGVVRRYQNAYPMTSELRSPLSKETLIERITSQGQNSRGEMIRPAGLKNELPKSLRKFLITTPLRIAHYFGQMARETGRFASFVEDGDLRYFDRYEPGTNQGYKLGNNVVGDGARFKGRGTIHLTGRENYRNYGKYRNPSDEDFFTTEPNNLLPVEDAYFSCDAGGYYWASKQKYIYVNGRLAPSGSLGVNYWADKGCSMLNAEEVTRRINPAVDGFDLVRWPAFEHSWYALNDEITPPLNYIRII
ncbi:peptidase M23 [Salmonella enterica subsp. salamae]|nr:peptidase M23 [Salmonella enterica subsp. salamae]